MKLSIPSTALLVERRFPSSAPQLSWKPEAEPTAEPIADLAASIQRLVPRGGDGVYSKSTAREVDEGKSDLECHSL